MDNIWFPQKDVSGPWLAIAMTGIASCTSYSSQYDIYTSEKYRLARVTALLPSECTIGNDGITFVENGYRIEIFRTFEEQTDTGWSTIPSNSSVGWESLTLGYGTTLQVPVRDLVVETEAVAGESFTATFVTGSPILEPGNPFNYPVYRNAQLRRNQNGITENRTTTVREVYELRLTGQGEFRRILGFSIDDGTYITVPYYSSDTSFANITGFTAITVDPEILTLEQNLGLLEVRCFPAFN